MVLTKAKKIASDVANHIAGLAKVIGKDVGSAVLKQKLTKMVGLGKRKVRAKPKRMSDGRHPERPRRGRGQKGRGFWADLGGGIAGLLLAETGPAGAMAGGLGVKTLLNQLGLGRRGAGVTTHPTVSSSGFAKI